MSSSSQRLPDIGPSRISGSVLSKLLFFSAAMVLLPLSSYYLSLNYVFSGYKTTYAAIVAAIMANVVLVGYLIVAFLEDDGEGIEKGQLKKAQ
ncbi:hypothetical protein BCR37DRAFT_381031 [Protomyces lactucae-debilis]|uniref:Uncharacterized protein n=1 Tax=Protomyces lactucae-debilis TaxID=2754530 RepID=A0A1Y2F8X1_PROLT|nr:uncharacterized protein BCR37DRAFT_381031 [Protomyces lactucae-debilis]ORY80362.1 hypothetical protein BCR37DRAFT_381031 [Protomyces lactucae-debilis]